MPFAAALSTEPQPRQAAEDVCRQLTPVWSGTPELAFVFFSPHHLAAADVVADEIRTRLAPTRLVGCVGESIVGNDREVEQQPALSVWLGRWPRGMQVEPFHTFAERTPDGVSLIGWPDGLDGADPNQSVLLLLGDPYTFPIDLFFTRLRDVAPGIRVMGGMASGGGGPGDSRLLLDGEVHARGAVGVLLQGAEHVRSVVSQGCRPIGRSFVVTKIAQENVIAELSGEPALHRLRELWQSLSPEDQPLFQHGLHIGRVINEYQGEFHRGDFLVRNVQGIDPRTGSVAITDRVRVGQTVQFHVRDARTADEDLHTLLRQDLAAHQTRPAGGLVFTCNGRGTRMFAEPSHDARAVRAEAGDIPLAGFFAQGELGPIGGQNFIHGFTASVIFFEE